MASGLESFMHKVESGCWENSLRDEVPSIFFSPAEKNGFPFFYKAFEKVATFWGQNESTREINS